MLLNRGTDGSGINNLGGLASYTLPEGPAEDHLDFTRSQYWCVRYSAQINGTQCFLAVIQNCSVRRPFVGISQFHNR